MSKFYFLRNLPIEPRETKGRKSMKRTLLLLIAACLLASQAHALVLVDSAKKVIGEVVDTDFQDPGWVWVAIQHGTATALVLFGRQRFTTFDVIEYTGGNCTGESGIRVTSTATAEDVLWLAAIAPPGQTL